MDSVSKEADDLWRKLRAAYDAVSEWPERKGEPIDVGAQGFMGLLELRNLVHEALSSRARFEEATRLAEREHIQAWLKEEYETSEGLPVDGRHMLHVVRRCLRDGDDRPAAIRALQPKVAGQ